MCKCVMSCHSRTLFIIPNNSVIARRYDAAISDYHISIITPYTFINPRLPRHSAIAPFLAMTKSMYSVIPALFLSFPHSLCHCEEVRRGNLCYSLNSVIPMLSLSFPRRRESSNNPTKNKNHHTPTKTIAYSKNA